MKLLLLKLLQPSAFAGTPPPKPKRKRAQKPKPQKNHTAPPRMTAAQQKETLDYALDPNNWK